MSPWEERIVTRLHDVLRTPPPPRAPVGVLGPVAALAELERWLADDHQWRDAQWRDWSSLIVDVCDGFDALPHRARSEVAAAGSTPWLAALVTQRRRLEREGKHAIDAALRTDLAGALAGLRAALETRQVLVGIWDDLVRAVRVGAYEREEATAALLGDVAAARGSAWEAIADRIRGVLADIELDVEAARAEVSGASRPARRFTTQAAGMSAKERLALVRALLAVPVEAGRCVVWLAFPHGRVDQFVLPVGVSVTLFDGAWLASVLQHWEDSAHAHETVPKELVEYRDEVLSSWRRSEDVHHFAAVRVDVGSGNIANALDRAKDSADALLRLTALHTGTQPPWRRGPFILFVDGRLRSRTIGLDEPHAARHRPRGPDHVSACVATLADLVGPHLPVTAREVHETLELLRWLDEARETWDPARLALCDRVVEQAAGWAGVPDGQRFALAHLAAPWAWSQVMGEIDAVGRAAVYAIGGGPFTASAPDRRAAFLEALGTRGLLTQSRLGETIHRQAIIEHLEWLISWQDPAGEPAAALKALARRLRDGGAAARWMRGLTVDFARLLRRAKRTRNAIVHGGPIAPDTVAAVLTFVDSIAVDSLDLVMRARMTGRNPGDVFAERTARFTCCLAELDAGVPPAQALFWKPSPDT